MKNKILILLCLCSLLLVAPVTAAERRLADHPDRLIYKPLRFNPPQAQRHTLNNGMVVYVLEDRELPLVNVSAVFRSGSVHDPADKAGLAELTHRVMRTGGAGSLSGDDLDDLLAFHGISCSFSAEMDMGSAHLSVLKQDLELGLDIFSRILRQPRFAEDKLQLAKDLTIEGLRGLRDNPSGYAFREFRKLLYRDNPRGNLYSVASVKGLQRSDLIDFHQRFFHPQAVMLAITGDVTTAEAIRLADRYLGDWKAPGSPIAIPPPAGRKNGMIHYLHKEIPQSVIVTGHLAPSKRDQDFYAFTVLDFIMGSGGFRSRIFQEVRSERGLAYSTGSFYKARHDYGAFGAYAMTRSSATTAVLTLLRDLIKDVKIKDVTQEELSWAKKSINNSFIFSFQAADQIASQQMMLEFDSLQQDFLMKYPGRIGHVTAEDLQRTAGRYLNREKAVTLVLGNEKAFDAPLSTLGEVIRIEGDL
ncbi:MAG: insulinase family protein [Syntrophus sp. (in: bacteria)]|nr:insulinase family protein [Syntrophus sp. (in: bacteria)]